MQESTPIVRGLGAALVLLSKNKKSVKFNQFTKSLLGLCAAACSTGETVLCLHGGTHDVVGLVG
jgi:hypothetical protein